MCEDLPIDNAYRRSQGNAAGGFLFLVVMTPRCDRRGMGTRVRRGVRRTRTEIALRFGERVARLVKPVRGLWDGVVHRNPGCALRPWAPLYNGFAVLVNNRSR